MVLLGPTILDHVEPGMSVGEEEIFGPVAFVLKESRISRKVLM